MRFGISAYDLGAAELVELAMQAEAAGFSSLWLGEHLFMPADYGTVHPTREPEEERSARIVGPDTRLLDPLVALAGAAARTTRIELATGIYLLPLRHPLAVARAALTLAELSDDRFVLGVGSGWLREEFEALGVPFTGRGARTEEAVEVLRAAWAGGVFDHTGEHYRFGPVQVTSVARPVPLILGGNTPVALRRAARLADGWFASGNPSTGDALHYISELRRAEAGCERPTPLSVHVRVSPPSLADLDRFEKAGVDQLIFWAHELCPPGPDRWGRLAAAAEALGIPDRPASGTFRNP